MRKVVLAAAALTTALACSDDDEARSLADASRVIDGGTDAAVDLRMDAQTLDAMAVVEAGQPEAATADAAAPPMQAVSLRFRARVGNEEFACDRRYVGQGSGKVEIRPQDFRFFVENVRLIDRAGKDVVVQLTERTPFQTESVALVDFTNGSGSCAGGNTQANTQITGQVPVGDYVGLAFSTAVPAALNHGDPALAPMPLRAPGAHWGWLRGYRFLMAQVEATSLADAGTTGGSQHGGPEPGVALIHLGELNCTGGVGGAISCAIPNRNEVRLPAFDVASQTIVADLGAIFADVDITTGVTCHLGGEQYCAAMFPPLGLDLQTGLPVATQRVFRVE